MRWSRSLVVTTALLAASIGTPAHAQVDFPVITPSFSGRGLTIFANAEGPDVHDEFDKSTRQNGPFVYQGSASVVGNKGSSSTGAGEIKSSVGAFKIESSGSGNADASTISDDGDSDHTTVVFITVLFSVPVDATFSLVGTFEATGSGPSGRFGIFGGHANVSISVQGSRPDGFPFSLRHEISGDATEPVEFADVEVVEGNTTVRLQFMASSGASNDASGTANAAFKYFFELDFGDKDGDGLLDEWEISGIDIDNDGTPEIDLPAIGSDPDKKNLFVELDSQSGVSVDLNAIAMVEQAFADAPGSMVDNPDGSDGILLFFLIDESNLTNEDYDDTTGFPPEFDAAKATHFGSPDLRSNPARWNKLKDIYALIFRYCIWGRAIYYDKDDGAGGTFKSYISGVGELPGNDFFVAAGSVSSWYLPGTLRRNALAGTLMHELGHTIGLHHGGQEDEPNYKPNYLSSMNYAYQMPWKNITVEGTPISSAWFLDYARTAPSTLNEKFLREDRGFDGPPDLDMIFNTSPDTVAPVLMIVDANASEIDWNHSGPPIETSTIKVDLTRFKGNTDTLDASLEPFTDWDRLWYALTGADDFADGSHGSTSEIEPFEFEDFESINALVVHDRRSPDEGPTIDTQASDQSVEIGAEAQFALTASGPGTLTYQWQRSPEGSSDWSDVTDDSTYTGATTATLSIAAVTSEMSGDMFRCIVTDGDSLSTTSNTATLTVPEPPQIGAEPQDANAAPLQEATFTVTVTGTPPPDIQWERKPSGSQTWDVVVDGGIPKGVNGNKYVNLE